jgi:hypothetical protein
VTALRAKGMFPAIAVGTADLKPGTRVLRLETTIVEYEKGGGATRRSRKRTFVTSPRTSPTSS